ncbi:hypothetical protein H4219_004392 [Mycoemilia scoparia]|uniref:Mitochondrial resolvase Ydc2 catalytic domain-containing protein n=1 Tax=Mycoemilia scoparia TaxID=417184 RepID=A0A9W8DLJ8_9FUNG|nr:hypothetical protein H4219_004392 [Mycoemilia scoparia]
MLKQCGLPLTGKKSIKISRLETHIKEAQKLCLKRYAYKQSIPLTDLSAKITSRDVPTICAEAVPNQVVSIDIGYRNMAFIHMTRDRQILDWKHVELLPNSSYEPWEVSKKIREFVTQLLPKIDCTQGSYIIEHQRFRTNGGSAVSNSIMLTNVIEALIYSNLGLHDSHVDAINPAAVSAYLDLPALSNKYQESLNNADLLWTLSQKNKTKKSSRLSASRHRFKKKIAIAIVDSWLNGVGNDIESSTMETTTTKKDTKKPKGRSKTPPPTDLELPQPLVKIGYNDEENNLVQWRQYFELQKKKDDLSDCLLQAMVWLDWQVHTVGLLKDLTKIVGLKLLLRAIKDEPQLPSQQ